MTNVIDLDQLWFARHPARQFRLRAATRGEIETFRPAHLPGVTTLRAIVRCSDGRVRLFIESVHRRVVDADELLGDLYRQLEDPRQ